MYLGSLLDLVIINETCFRHFIGQRFEKKKTRGARQLCLGDLETLVVLLTNFPNEFSYEIWQRNSPYMVV